MASLETAYEQVAILAEDFKNNEKYYIQPDYSEAQARKDFIDKFFIALGWDVNHEDQKDPYRQEVKVERGVSVLGAQRRADYSFSIAPNYRDPKFFVEAKKPSRQLESGDDYFQAIRYGWNTQNPLVVLTDFEELHILDSRFRPDIKSILNYCHQKYHYSEYLDKEKFKKIYCLFSREAVENNSIENYAAELPKPKGKKGILAPAIKSFDQALLDELDETRESLAHAFKRKNNDLTSEELTEATQRVIDRLVFIRFLEDKLIEGERHISGYSDKQNTWQDFIKDCRTFDAKYNGIVFKYHDIIDSGNFNPPDDKEFSNVCADLSHVNSPYDFNFIPIHILGSIYERFLGKVVHATAKQVKVEEKPEVRKAGGVYYTPQYIVKYIVDNTVGKILRTPQAKAIPPLTKGGTKGGSVDNTDGFGLTPKQISELRFADISCGSGSFLITVFDTLLEYHGRWYQSHTKEAKADGCILKDGKWILSLHQKREILLNNIYGVDIDYQAVEVTQLSLFLKLLEDETLATAHEMQTLFKERILPDLSKNIVCGNSLIGTDISAGGLFETSDEKKINAMNFEDRFPEIMKNGGFDAIVGNPPYVNIQYVDEITKNYFRSKYNVFAGKADLLYFFFEKALTLLKKESLLGLITSRYFIEATDAKPLRQYISKNSHVIEFVDFRNYGVFKGIGIHTIITIIEKGKKGITKVKLLNEVSNQPLINEKNFNIFDVSLNNEEWTFTNKVEKGLFDKIKSKSLKLGDLATIEQGQKSGLNKVFGINKDLANNFEKEPLRKLIKNSHIKRYYVNYKDLYLIYADVNFKIDNYPLIEKYLLQHKRELFNRAEAKDNLYPWYRLQRPRDKRLFDAIEKIIVPYRAESNQFAYDDKQYFNDGGDIRVIVINKNKEYHTKFCIGILNSRLMNFYYQFIGRRKGKMLEYFVEPLAKIPIININFTDPTEKSKHDKMVSLVDQMLDAKKKQMESNTERDKSFWENKCNSLDSQIDTLVYELYGLTEEEIKIVEGENK